MNQKDSVFRFKKAEDSSGFLLWQVSNLWAREIKKALEPFGLTHSQFVLLASMYSLELQKQEVTQVLLSQYTKIDVMTTSTVLRTLEKKNLIRRKENSQDSRAKTVELTKEGSALIQRAIPQVEDFDQQFFAGLGDQRMNFNTELMALLESNSE